MNQRNIFTLISVVLILQGIAFYAMGDKIAASSFPDVDATGNAALAVIFTVLAMLSIFIGIVAFAARNSPEVLWGFTLGVTLLTLNTLKHYFIDHLNVPIPAIAIQVISALLCIYLWLQSRKTVNA